MNRLNEVIELRESGQWLEAKAIILELLEQEPDNPSFWYQCAWIHDVMGLEREAVPFYEKSLVLGLQGEEKQGAILGLGSTYRTLGMYEQAKTLFEKAIEEFPGNREFQVFYAMVLYNLNEHSKAMEILLIQLSETSSDEGIQTYKKAIHFYSNKLDQLWE
ncbi:tetratricopeptide repeat protein [Paenibacillus sedimenti]|uniref:Tetratricopeptide repeat protein n=1 Tax=Paenibacillus sedimenti TaxID=2770274 RepID=A0A926QI43_9BACL|nr:tetratricopeptide repeat protein [Paenibacillus sedimenti]MBD0380201.1 tetratricopeptide repeat protein [Paenibacillus sedimenti]